MLFFVFPYLYLQILQTSKKKISTVRDPIKLEANSIKFECLFFIMLSPLDRRLFFATSLQMTYRQCLCDPVKVSITKHSPSLRQYARSLSLHGLKCSDRSVEYVVVSTEKTKERNAVRLNIECS